MTVAQGTPSLTAWNDDVALMGPDAPMWNGQIEHLIRYLLTVHKRFGNTAIAADIELQWGGSALRKRDEQKHRIADLEAENAALSAQVVELQQDAQWAKTELLEIMRIVGSPLDKEDDIIRLMKLHAIRLLVDVDHEKYEALLDDAATGTASTLAKNE